MACLMRRLIWPYLHELSTSTERQGAEEKTVLPSRRFFLAIRRAGLPAARIMPLKVERLRGFPDRPQKPTKQADDFGEIFWSWAWAYAPCKGSPLQLLFRIECKFIR